MKMEKIKEENDRVTVKIGPTFNKKDIKRYDEVSFSVKGICFEAEILEETEDTVTFDFLKPVVISRKQYEKHTAER